MWHSPEVVVPIEALAPGDRFVVRPGEQVATDGVVVSGTSAVDQSILHQMPRTPDRRRPFLRGAL